VPKLLTAERLPDIMYAAGVVGWIVGMTLRFMDKLTIEQFTVWNCVICGLWICKWIVQRRLMTATPQIGAQQKATPTVRGDAF
jgi:hypothetical protein